MFASVRWSDEGNDWVCADGSLERRCYKKRNKYFEKRAFYFTFVPDQAISADIMGFHSLMDRTEVS